jgi:hypothetical protein
MTDQSKDDEPTFAAVDEAAKLRDPPMTAEDYAALRAKRRAYAAKRKADVFNWGIRDRLPVKPRPDDGGEG